MIDAILLAAGYGSRLGELGRRFPKCLLAVNGIPLLLRWLIALEHTNVDRVWVNLHHRSDLVNTFLEGIASHFEYEIITFPEPELLGTAGTCAAIARLNSLNNTLVVHADNYSEIDLSGFLSSGMQGSSDILLGQYFMEKPVEAGVIISAYGKIQHFFEKPDIFKGHWCNAAVYFFKRRFMELLAEESEGDLSQIIQAHSPGNSVFTILGNHIDCGSIERLESATLLSHGSSVEPAIKSRALKIMESLYPSMFDDGLVSQWNKSGEDIYFR